MTIITIPAELVSLVRDGARFDLSTQLHAIDDLLDGPRPWADIREEVAQGVARENGAIALLDALHWIGAEEERAVDVDVCEHREVLLRALLVRIGVERDVESDVQAGVGERAEAKVHAGQLVAFVQRVEEGGE
jgi:hypothetical protein